MTYNIIYHRVRYDTTVTTVEWEKKLYQAYNWIFVKVEIYNNMLLDDL